VKTDTLDGSTAGFVAAIANALSRKISSGRMVELIAVPEKLRKLLLPVISDDHILVMREVAFWSQYGAVDLMSDLVQIRSKGWCGVHPSMRNLMREAYERKYAPLSEDQAKYLCELAAEYLAFRVVFPYVKGEKVWVCQLFSGGEIRDSEVNLDMRNENLMNFTFFFTSGFPDRSNCFKC